MNGLSTRIVTEPDQWRELRLEWDALLDDSEQRSFFLRWDWNWRWWRHLAPTKAELFIVCCRDRAGRLAGVAPLYARRRTRLPLVSVRELHLLGTGTEVCASEHVGPFARRGAEQVVARAIARRLQDERGWDRLGFARVPAGSVVAHQILGALDAQPLPARTELAPVLDTSRGWAACRASMGRTMRRLVEVLPRRLFARHECAVERIRQPGDLPHAFDDLVSLHQARWSAIGERGSFADPAVAGFIRDCVQDAFAAGRLRLWRLRVDGRPEAALLGFFDHGTVHYFQSGFNPACADARPGTVLLALAIRECCEDPEVRAFDFMAGDLDYKLRWTSQAATLEAHECRRVNARTMTDEAWAGAVDVATRVYRATAPRRLREARRRWLRSRAPAAERPRGVGYPGRNP